MTPHDTLFKETFSRPFAAEALLRWALPPEVRDSVRWEDLRLHDPGVRSHHRPLSGDLLYPASGPGVMVFFLLEHKSRPDPTTCWQLFRYLSAIWQEHHARRGRRILLPAVQIVVVLHGRRRWRRFRRLADLIGWPRSGSGPEPAWPELPYVLVDLTRMSGEEIHAPPLPPLVKLTLFCLQRARSSRDILAELRAWIPELRELRRSPDGGRGLGCVLWYVAQVADVDHEDLDWFVARELGQTAQEAMMSAAKELMKIAKAELIHEARAQGLAQGRAEGHLEGRVELLRKLLTVRFCTLGRRTEQRLRRATPEQLDLWGERLLTAGSLRAVFAD